MSEGIILGFYFLGIFTGVIITGIILLVLTNSTKFIDIIRKDEKKKNNW